MALTREQQAQFAEAMLPLIDTIKDIESLRQLQEMAALVLEWAGFEDNGIAFDLSEYAYEMREIAKGKQPDGWADHAKESLEKQLQALRKA